MSRTAQVLLALTVVFWTIAGTVDFGPESATARDVTILWVTGGITLLLAFAVDSQLARRKIPFLRPSHTETQQELGRVVHEGQRLLGRLNAYEAHESDTDAEEYWSTQVQLWTDWADGIIRWRLPHMRDNFGNQADRPVGPVWGTKWQHSGATWMQTCMKRLNEWIISARELQEGLGPKPAPELLREPTWPDPPKPLRVRREEALQASAHVHDVPHDPKRDKEGEQIPLANGEPDPSVCHDCGRSLINDVGTERLLLCPKLHGHRPPELRPSLFDGAVECGQPND